MGMMLLVWTLGCAKENPAPTVEQFCALVESVAAETDTGDTVYLYCGGSGEDDLCDMDRSTLLEAKYGTVERAGAACLERSGGDYIGGDMGDFTICGSYGGPQYHVYETMCSVAPTVF